MLPRTNTIVVGKVSLPVIVSSGDEKVIFQSSASCIGDVQISVENNFSWYVFYRRVQEEPQKKTSSSTFVPYL